MPITSSTLSTSVCNRYESNIRSSVVECPTASLELKTYSSIHERDDVESVLDPALRDFEVRYHLPTRNLFSVDIDGFAAYIYGHVCSPESQQIQGVKLLSLAASSQIQLSAPQPSPSVMGDSRMTSDVDSTDTLFSGTVISILITIHFRSHVRIA
jgi:hypothetical protein